MSRLTAPLARVPVRVRVTLAFTAAMAVLLAATGLFLYVRLGHELDATINQGLRSRAGDVSALIEQADSGLAQAGRSPLTAQGESLAQVVTPRGQVVDASPQLRSASLLRRSELQRASKGSILTDHARTPLGNESRLLATPVTAQGKHLIVVVGTSLEGRDSAQGDLGSLLVLGGPIALLLASLVGYAATAGALRPVELMRRRARAIQASRPGQRLPVPAARDEVGRLGETLNEMLERLEDALAREKTFVSDASHELRTPLTILKGELQLALESATTPVQLRQALISAEEETDRLVQLAEDLLVIARSDKGGLPVRLEDVDLEELLVGVQQRFAQRAEDRDATLVVSAPEGLVIRADSMRLEQAVGNLVDNALRHGGRIIELSAHAMDGRTELHVSDDGLGFPPGFEDAAFERFARADTARGRGGAGLGLAIVAVIADAHGGSAHARNREGGGADVWVELAAGQAAGEPPSARKRYPAPRTVSIDSTSKGRSTFSRRYRT